MSQASFDTHAAIRKLERAGCPAPQAEAMVSVVMQATGVSLQLVKDVEQIRLHVETNMASKADLADLRTEMHAGFASIDSRFEKLDARVGSLEAGFEKLDARQEQTEKVMVTKGELYRALWIQGGVLATLILTLAGSMLGFALFLLNTS